MATDGNRRRIGLVVNPIAGMGGRVGLKGTDGMVEEARARGAKPRAPARAKRALDELIEIAPDTELYVAGHPMGAAEAAAAGFDPIIVSNPSGETAAADTATAVNAFLKAGVDLIMFVGGDGTAADIAASLETAEDPPPMLGIPAGVKMFSSVFATTPENAARLAATFDRVETREVMDIDEEAYRGGSVQAKLLDVLEVPIGPDIQSGKQLSRGDIGSVTAGVAAEVDPETTYILGAGSTLMELKHELGFEGSPLGIDVWRDDAVISLDADEATLLEVIEPPATIIVSPIGGQGFILGRGTQQLSPEVIRRCDLMIISSRKKLEALDVLRVDTDDPELDEELKGWIRVRVGRHEHRMMRVE